MEQQAVQDALRPVHTAHSFIKTELYKVCNGRVHFGRRCEGDRVRPQPCQKMAQGGRVRFARAVTARAQKQWHRVGRCERACAEANEAQPSTVHRLG